MSSPFEGAALQQLVLFESLQRLYVAGCPRVPAAAAQQWSILEFDRTTPGELTVRQRAEKLSTLAEVEKKVAALVASLVPADDKTGKKARSPLLGKITKQGKIAAVLGVVRFMASHYLVVVTRSTRVGTIAGQHIYSVRDYELVPVVHEDYETSSYAESEAELKYKELFEGVNLRQDCYFSYQYDLTSTLQVNTERCPRTRPANGDGNEHKSAADGEVYRYNEMFLWNYFVANEFLSHVADGSRWLVPLIQGFFSQKDVRIGQDTARVTLIARRSRHRAGARFMRRGLNGEGYVANEVETEQIVHDSDVDEFHAKTGKKSVVNRNKSSLGAASSFVMVRGSVPLFWTQEEPLAPRPTITVHKIDEGHAMSLVHYDHLFKRYGSPVMILSLLRETEHSSNEKTLGKEFAASIDQVNQRLALDKDVMNRRILFKTYDFLGKKKQGCNVTKDIGDMASAMVRECGVFCIGKLSMPHASKFHATSTKVSSGVDVHPAPAAHDDSSNDRNNDTEPSSVQRGVMRVNCVDCLDRTNVAMYVIGKEALKLQLQALGVIDTKMAVVFFAVNSALQQAYTAHGDRIAEQYASSGALHSDAIEQPPFEHTSVDHGGAANGNSNGNGNGNGNGSSFSPSAMIGGGISANSAINSIKRYYSNNFTDQEKQHSINVFLGNYIFSGIDNAHIWEANPSVQIGHVNERYPASEHKFFAHPCVTFDIDVPDAAPVHMHSYSSTPRAIRQCRRSCFTFTKWLH